MRFVLILAVAALATATVTARAQPRPALATAGADRAPASGTAHAEPAPASESHLSVPIAVAVNVPFAWPWSFAASAWAGVDEHHAIRANYARYHGPLWAVIPNMLESEGLEEGEIPPDFGHTTDVSVGWVYYPRCVLDGATLEVGALLRHNHLRDRIDSKNVASEEQFTNVYGARALAGWTWRLSDVWFLSTGIGASAGYERGREKKFLGYDFSHGAMDIVREGSVSRVALSVEAYLRVGLAFKH